MRFLFLSFLVVVDLFELLDGGGEVVDGAAHDLGLGHVDAGDQQAVKGRLGAAALEEVDILDRKSVV